MPEIKDRAQGTWGLMMLLMFLFGGTVGYIARDVRADEEIKRAASDARLDAPGAPGRRWRRSYRFHWWGRLTRPR